MNYREGEQKAFIDWIYSAKTESTRITPIAATIDEILKKQKFSDRE